MKKSQSRSNLAPARHEMLRDIVRQNGIARVEELCKRLKVSPATIRRDLEQLEESGRIRRVHGGAVSLESRLEEPLFDDKTSIAAREKRRIAAAAAKYVHSGDVIYLDGGSTVLELARLLADRTDITVVTNSLRAAVELSGRGPRLILAGGELRRLSQTTVGPLTTPLLQQVQVNTAFMGTMGLTVSDGLTTTDPAEAFTKEFVLSRADRTVLLADRTKLGKVAFVNAGAVKHVDVLITDKAADKKTIAAIKKSGVKVVGV